MQGRKPMAKTVEAYLEKKSEWRAELNLLRKIMLKTGLEETIKWSAPVYTCEGKNIIGLGAFKSYVGLWFFQGALLKDKQNKLVNAQEGKTKAQRQWRFDSLEQIEREADLIRTYVEEAITNQKQGREMKPVRKKQKVSAPELERLLERDRELKTKYKALSEAKQREYAEYIREAKQAATKERRLKKIIPMLMQGVGLNDKYRK